MLLLAGEPDAAGWMLLGISAAVIFWLAAHGPPLLPSPGEETPAEEQPSIASLCDVSHRMSVAGGLEALLRAFADPLKHTGLKDVLLFYADSPAEQAQQGMRMLSSVALFGSPLPPLSGSYYFADLLPADDPVDTLPVIVTLPDLPTDHTGLDERLAGALLQRGTRTVTVVRVRSPGQHHSLVTLLLAWPKVYELPPVERSILAMLAPQFATFVENHCLLETTASQIGYRNALLRAMPVGLSAMDRDLRIVDVTPRLEAITGYNREELVGSTMGLLTAPEYGPHLNEQIKSVIDDGATIRYETVGVHKDSSRYSMRMHLSPLLGADGSNIGVVGAVEDLQRHRQTEAALIESRQMLKLVMDNIPQAIYWKDETLAFLGCNQTFAEHVGLASPEESVGLMEQDFDLPEAQAIASQEADRRVMETGEAEIDVVEPQVLAGGRTIWRRVSRVPLTGPLGESVGVLVTYEDITEQREIEAAEREQRGLAEALRATAAAINSTLDIDEVFDRILENLWRVVPHDSANIMMIENGEASVVRLRRYSGYTLDHTLSSVSYKVADTPNMLEMVTTRKALYIEDTAAYPDWIINTDTKWIRSHLGAPIVVGDEVIGLLHADSMQPYAFETGDAERLQAFADQAAIALKNAQLYAAARERNDRLEMLNRLTRVGTTMLDLQELVETLAATAAGIIGSWQCFITLWDEQKQAIVPAAASSENHEAYQSLKVASEDSTLSRQALREGRPIIADSRTTPYMSDSVRSQFLEQFPAETLLTLPLKTHERDIGALLIAFKETHTFTDDELAWAEQAAELTALAIAQAQAYAGLEARVESRTSELMEANRRLLELSHMKDEFVSNVSHELRTPIASIKLYHHLLTIRPEKQPAYIERLARETDRLERIVEDLLYLSRMDQDTAESNVGIVDINYLLETYLTDRSLLAEQRELVLEYTLDEGVPVVVGDEMALGRVIDVLLTNAFNYTPAAGRVVVETSLEEIAGVQWAVLLVCDSGPGIPPEERDRIFERFFRGKAGHSSGMPGTGLGLSIAREIAERYDGKLVLLDHTPQGHGACFELRLPAAGSTLAQPGTDDRNL